MRLILASASPRRKQILFDAGIAFETQPADIDEEELLAGIPGTTIATTGIDLPSSKGPEDVALLLAREKAAAVLRHFTEDVQILAADTIVVRQNRIYGKPKSPHVAKAMLRELSGNTHTVITAHVLFQRSGNRQTSYEKAVQTEVRFRELSDSDIMRYVQTDEPYDKAGAYAIQGTGATLVASIHGDYLNVVGLSLNAILEWIRPRKLFVYGTLLRGMPAHSLLADRTQFVARGSIQGQLYDVGPYPAATGGAGRVYGEVYEINDPELWDELDDYEEPSENAEEPLYRRSIVQVKTEDGQVLEAMTYVTDSVPPHSRRIEHGSFARYVAGD